MNKRPPKNGVVRVKLKNTLLVDGNALFKQSFFGAKSQYTKDGVYIGGLYQFFTTLRMLLVNDLYHRVYVFWDGKLSGKLRYDIYNDYKIDRGKDYLNGTHPVDEDEVRQKALIRMYINEMYIRQIMDDITEGDDFIAHYCLNKKANEKVTICTNDRDMAQLIDDNVRIYFLNLKTYVDKNNFSSYFCYHLDNAALVKTIVGDASDSIKGIKGLKEKGLLKLYPELSEKKLSLTEIINKAKELQDERLKTKKKPLLVLDNIVNCVTEGIQGSDMYIINDKLVNLKKPMMSDNAIALMDEYMDGILSDDRDFQKIFKWMKRDGLEDVIGPIRYPDYLTPFKLLKDREKDFI